MPSRLPALLADPPAADEPLWLTNASLFDGLRPVLCERAAVLVESGRIARVAEAAEPAPAGVTVVD